MIIFVHSYISIYNLGKLVVHNEDITTTLGIYTYVQVLKKQMLVSVFGKKIGIFRNKGYAFPQ